MTMSGQDSEHNMIEQILRMFCPTGTQAAESDSQTAQAFIQFMDEVPGGFLLYYADQGEDVWEIAKAYRTSASRIVEENDLAGNVLEKRRMLLIPAVR